MAVSTDLDFANISELNLDPLKRQVTRLRNATLFTVVIELHLPLNIALDGLDVCNVDWAETRSADYLSSSRSSSSRSEFPPSSSESASRSAISTTRPICARFNPSSS